MGIKTRCSITIVCDVWSVLTSDNRSCSGYGLVIPQLMLSNGLSNLLYPITLFEVHCNFVRRHHIESFT